MHPHGILTSFHCISKDAMGYKKGFAKDPSETTTRTFKGSPSDEGPKCIPWDSQGILNGFHRILTDPMGFPQDSQRLLNSYSKGFHGVPNWYNHTTKTKL